MRAEQVVRRLGRRRSPSLITIWFIVRGVDTGVLEEAVQPWLPNDQVYAADGNVRRGRTRAGQCALEVLTLVGQTFGHGLAHRAVDKGDDLAAVVALLAAVPLAG
ncbi:hypothetical protein [Chloroflexus sp.]|uniref:hypothetical protein n=1 Tax=Chloroflexus sp. TaxID=1904827 RepID=UPI004049CD7A